MRSFSKMATAVTLPLSLALGGAGCMVQPSDDDAAAAPEATDAVAQADCNGDSCTPNEGRPPVFGHPPVCPPPDYPPPCYTPPPDQGPPGYGFPPVYPPRGWGHGYPPRGWGHGYPPRGWNDGYPPRGWGDGYPPDGDGWSYYGAAPNHGPVSLPGKGLPPSGSSSDDGHGDGHRDH